MVRWRSILPCILALGLFAGTADAAKEYRAPRFDVRLDLAHDGSMTVTERIVFAFGRDSFTYVFRDLPTRRTDGISVDAVSMDGVPLERGTKAGQFEVKREKDGLLRATVRFPSLTASTHVVELVYRVSGVVEAQTELDVLAWRVLPSKHEYTIECSSVEIVPPGALTTLLRVRTDQAANRSGTEAARPKYERCSVGTNETWVVTIEAARGSLTDNPPAWQQRDVRAGHYAPIFAAMAAAILLGGGMGLFFYWNNHRPTAPAADRYARLSRPPSDLPVALAGVITRVGASPAWANALGALLGLARRGVVRVEETEKKWGQRQFQVVNLGARSDLHLHETVLIDMLFTTRKGPRTSATFGDLGNAAKRQWKRFRVQTRQELRERGLVSTSREQSARTLQHVALALVIVAAPGLIAAGLAASLLEGWPILVPGSLLIVGVMTFAMSASMTPLSDEGLRQAAAWKAFRSSVRDMGRGSRSSLEPQRFEEWLPYAATFGLALGWAKALKKRGTATAAPAWFQVAASSRDDGLSGMIAALTAATSAGGHVDGGASGAGAAGAAGGGASGAG